MAAGPTAAKQGAAGYPTFGELPRAARRASARRGPPMPPPAVGVVLPVRPVWNDGRRSGGISTPLTVRPPRWITPTSASSRATAQRLGAGRPSLWDVEPSAGNTFTGSACGNRQCPRGDTATRGHRYRRLLSASTLAPTNPSSCASAAVTGSWAAITYSSWWPRQSPTTQPTSTTAGQQARPVPGPRQPAPGYVFGSVNPSSPLSSVVRQEGDLRPLAAS